MLRTSLGQLLINDALPPDMRDYSRVLDKKGVNELLRQLANKYPDKYREVSKRLSDIGRTAATEFGGYSLSLRHLQKSKISKDNRVTIERKLAEVLNNDKLTAEQRKSAIIRAVGAAQEDQIKGIYDEALKSKNPLAMQVASGSRGNPMNLSSLLGSDLLYTDHRDEVLPLPVLSSYSEGLKPLEYWAATYGTRRGVMATKFAVQDAGFLSKQLNQIAHRLLVVGDDDERENMGLRGLPVDTTDAENEGALLAHDVGGYKRNTVLTPKIMSAIKRAGHDRILVRSPAVGGSPDGGVYARDVGINESGRLPGRGEEVGLTAAQMLSEPLSQGQLSAKHSGGVAGQEKAVGGFAYIDQLVQIPKKMRGGAAHAEYDGKVTSVEPAPAGGHYVYIDSHRHYVPDDTPLSVKVGDTVEAGDMISEGYPHPAIITQHKGNGEGRRYLINAYHKAMKGASMNGSRRNIELLARGLINHVRLTDEYAGYVPDDVVPYSTLEHVYEPRDGHAVLDPRRSLGKYLERPVLHYTIGTKIRPSVLKELQHFGVKDVTVHDDPPPFQPEMIRGMYNLQHDPDWMTRMYGSGLKGSLLDAAHRGAVSDELGTSFVPGLARAVDFGRVGVVRTPEQGEAAPAEGQPFGKPPVRPALTTPMTAMNRPRKSIMPDSPFKMAELLNSAIEKVAVEPAKPHVDTTLPADTGSSTAAPATASRQVPTGGPPQPSSAPGFTGSLSHTPLTPHDFKFTPPAHAGPSMRGPDNTGYAAPPGQVHPDRMAQRGLLRPQDTPDQVAQFVTGGNNDYAQSPAGFVGAIARLGSLADTRAVSSLTGGNPYASDDDGEFHHDMMGGKPLSPNIMSSVLPSQSAAVPAPQVQPPQAQPPSQMTPTPATVNRTVPTASDPTYVMNQYAQQRGWQAGNADFDAVKATLPAGTPDAVVQRTMMDNVKKHYLYEKDGYKPGQPKFEAARNMVKEQLMQKIGGNVDAHIAKLNARLAQLKISEPQSPVIQEIQAMVQGLEKFKVQGIADSDVYAHIHKTVPVKGDISDYEYMRRDRGDFDPENRILRALYSPLTGSVVDKSLEVMSRNMVKPSVVNKLMGKQVFKAGEEAAAKQAVKRIEQTGLKAVLKKVPVVGWVVEAYHAANTPADELRAKYDDRLRNLEKANNGEFTPFLSDLLDNVENPGQILRAYGLQVQDAINTFDQVHREGVGMDANNYGQMQARLNYLTEAKQRRPLTEQEQKFFDVAQTQMDALKAQHVSSWYGRKENVLRNREDAEKLFADKAKASMLSATARDRRLREQFGEAAMANVLAGTASPHEQDMYREWIEAQKHGYDDPAAHLKMPSVSSVFGSATPQVYKTSELTPEQHAAYDQKYRKYLSTAIRLAEAGRHDEAKMFMEKADMVRSSKAERDKYLQGEFAKYESQYAPKPLGDGLPFGSSGLPESATKPWWQEQRERQERDRPTPSLFPLQQQRPVYPTGPSTVGPLD